MSPVVSVAIVMIFLTNGTNIVVCNILEMFVNGGTLVILSQLLLIVIEYCEDSVASRVMLWVGCKVRAIMLVLR